MIRYVISARMDIEGDWCYLGVCYEWELKEKTDHYYTTWRYIKVEQLDVGKTNAGYL